MPFRPGLLRSHYVNEHTRIQHAIKRQHHLHNARLDGIASRLDNCSNNKLAEQFAITHRLLYNSSSTISKIINQIIPTQAPLDITLTSQLFCLNKAKGTPTL